ncbi:unnamed protein product [Tilletia controversa]|nr:unnamed protein product [Tilletia controversa]
MMQTDAPREAMRLERLFGELVRGYLHDVKRGDVDAANANLNLPDTASEQNTTKFRFQQRHIDEVGSNIHRVRLVTPVALQHRTEQLLNLWLRQ